MTTRDARERAAALAALVDQLRQDLDGKRRADVDELLRPILDRAAALAAQHVDDGRDADEQLLTDVLYARALLTGGVIV